MIYMYIISVALHGQETFAEPMTLPTTTRPMTCIGRVLGWGGVFLGDRIEIHFFRAEGLGLHVHVMAHMRHLEHSEEYHRVQQQRVKEHEEPRIPAQLNDGVENSQHARAIPLRSAGCRKP
eukprot:scaffold78461_cov32-Prasinocladus_malaysianus.AAC.2